MFVVYSPDGRAAIGLSQALPSLKVEPSKATNAPKKVALNPLREEPEDAEKRFKAYNPAIAQYKNTLASEQDHHIVVKAKEIMTSPLITVSPDQSVEQVWALMNEHQIHHFPVLDGGVLIGLCSSQCIFNEQLLVQPEQLETLKKQPVSTIMRQEVVTTHLETDIRKMAFVMSHYRLGCLPIMSDTGDLLGIVTLSDMVKRLAEEPPIELYA